MLNNNSDDLLDRISGDDPEKPKESFEEGIIRAKSIREIMMDGFHHGKKRGDTTYFKSIDPHFTWKKTFVNCWTGYPGHGKTEMLLQLALIKSIMDNWKWLVFCPENMGNDGEGNVSADEFYDTLIHAYEGKSTDPAYNNQMTEMAYQKGIDFMDDHFIVIYPKKDRGLKSVLEHFEYIIGQTKIDGCIIDPWNRLQHKFTREDQYLAEMFAINKDFAVKHNVSFNITAHPKGGQVKEKDGSMPVPNQYMLSGGAMWDNAMDAILAVHRPNYHNDKTDKTVQFYSHKLKNQKLIGIPGCTELTFSRATNRYYESGISPIDNSRKGKDSKQQEMFDGNSKVRETIEDAPF